MRNKKCFIAAAGSGKTTHLITDFIENHKLDKVGFVTFTTTNQNNAQSKVKSLLGYIPSNFKVFGWYEFLFKFIINPYKSDVIPGLNIQPISLIFDSDYSRTAETKDGKRYTKYGKNDKRRKYFTNNWKLHKDLVAEFANECIVGNEDSIIRRFSRSFSALYFDEAQDFANHDFKIFKFLLKKFPGQIYIATDPRQHIYSTSKFIARSKYNGRIEEYIANEVNGKRKTYVDIDSNLLSESHRCMPEICELASALCQDMPLTIPCSCDECMTRRDVYPGEKGVFAVKEDDIEKFVNSGRCLSLIYDSRESCQTYGRKMTMGDSKGTEEDIVLIYPTKDMSRFLISGGEVEFADITRAKLYVAITRARFKLGIVWKEKFKMKTSILPIWHE